jgi:hypothetical protein
LLVFQFQLADALLVGRERLADARLAVLLGVVLGQPAAGTAVGPMLILSLTFWTLRPCSVIIRTTSSFRLGSNVLRFLVMQFSSGGGFSTY